MPARPERVVARLARLANLFKQDRSEAEWRMLFEDYARALRMYPDDVIADAFDACVRSSKWFPRVAEIVAHCEPEMRRRQVELYRLEQITFWSDAPAPPEPEPLTDADRAEVVNILDRLSRGSVRERR